MLQEQSASGQLTENFKSAAAASPSRERYSSEKIIYAWNYLEWGGAQIYFRAIMKIVRRHFDCRIVIPEGSDPQLLRFFAELGVECEFFETASNIKPAAKFSDKLKRHLTKIKSELAMLRRLRDFDLENCAVHVELAPWQSLLSLIWLCRRTDVFVTVHNGLPPVAAWRYYLWRLKFRIITGYQTFHIFASNQNAKENLRQFVGEEFYHSIKVTYTSVDPVEIAGVLEKDPDRTALLHKFGLPADKFVLLCVGQFVDRKGRWTFLEAAAKVLEKQPDIQFVWVAPNLPTPAEQALIDKYGLADKFRLIRSETIGTSRRAILSFFRIADAYALPSFVEGLPIALLEAMALGIPSISTNVYGIPEAVKHLETGWLIEAGDSDALANAVLQLKEDTALRERLGRAGQAFVLKKFDEREAAKTALEAYRESFER